MIKMIKIISFFISFFLFFIFSYTNVKLTFAQTGSNLVNNGNFEEIKIAVLKKQTKNGYSSGKLALGLTSTPTRRLISQAICTSKQTVCVPTSVCNTRCKACSKDGTYWYCTDTQWCNWCLSTAPTGTPRLTKIPSRRPTQGPTSILVCATKAKGDANCDGKIDGRDYSIWLNRQCTTGCSSENLKADFDNNSRVDDDDYSIWFNNRE